MTLLDQHECCKPSPFESGFIDFDSAKVFSGNFRIASTLPPPGIESDHPLYLVNQEVVHALRETAFFDRTGQCDLGDDETHKNRLVRAMLLQALYSFRCDRQLAEQLQYNVLYRWFVGLQTEDRVWNAAAYSSARKALWTSPLAQTAFRSVLLRVRPLALRWSSQFHIDLALFDAWIGVRSTATSVQSLPVSGVPVPDSADESSAAMEASVCTRLDKALAVISRRIAEPHLGPDTLASELCMSRRALYLLFEEHGLTPTATIRNLRLDYCKSLLDDPRQRHRKITDIALDCGFTDSASFSRQFKHRYGISPRDARTTSFGARNSVDRAPQSPHHPSR